MHCIDNNEWLFYLQSSQNDKVMSFGDFYLEYKKKTKNQNPKTLPKNQKKKQPRTDLPWMLKVKLEVSVRGRVLKPIGIGN